MQNPDQKKKNPKGKKNKFLGQIWNKNAELKEIKKKISNLPEIKQAKSRGLAQRQWIILF